MSLIGECKIRKRIHIYLSSIYKNKQAYTEYLEKEDTPGFLKQSENTIERIRRNYIQILYKRMV